MTMRNTVTENSAFWDADTYDIVSNAQEEWAKFIIKQRKWSGNEDCTRRRMWLGKNYKNAISIN